MKARLPKGMGGGPGNMNSMIKQAQKMQDDMTRVQSEIDEREFPVTVGGGAVEAVFKGNREMKALTIKPEAVDPDDVEMLQDLIISAVNEGLRTIEETTAAEMEKVTGGLALPGLF